jgi:hypothetical protein
MISKIMLLVALAVLANGQEQTLTYVPIHWTIVDRPKKTRIEVAYVNSSQQTLCISDSNLPTPSGAIASLGDQLALIVGSRRFQVRPNYTGHCVGDECTVRVPHGASIKAFIRYSEFELPRRYWFRPKKLIYRINAWVCE